MILRAFVIILLIVPTVSWAQWKLIAATGQIYHTIYFLDLPGPPRIGFIGADCSARATSSILKTTDGGKTWRSSKNWPASTITDFAFKDSMTGFAITYNEAIKTTDGGDSWFTIHPFTGNFGSGIYYDKLSGGLFLAQGAGLSLSWDEGTTWKDMYSIDNDHFGFAFSNDNVGVLSGASQRNNPWFKTTDAGHTWTNLSIDSDCYQPLAIRGSSTYFGITYFGGNFLRTDDGWNTWRIIHTFDGNIVSNFGCVRGDLCQLYVQLPSGIFQSTDEGLNWRSLGAEAPYLGPWPLSAMRFYQKDHYLYIVNVDTAIRQAGCAWFLDLDSINAANVQFSVSASSVRGGDTVQLDAGLSQLVPGYDTVSFRVRYDTTSSELVQLQTSSDWLLVDSSRSDGYLRLVFRKADSTAGGHIAQIFFRTLVSASESAKFVIDSVHFAGLPTRAGCATLALGGGDSVTIAIEGCGENTLRQFMSDSLLFRIVSVQPNPAQTEIAVTLSKSSPTVGIRYQIENQLGVTVLEDTFRGAPIGVGNLADGCYYLRMSCGRFHQSRKIMIQK